MSTTALVRSPSSNTSLTTSQPQQKAATSLVSGTASSRLSVTPQTRDTTPKTLTSTPQQQQQQQRPQYQQQPSPSPSTPGKWQHPRMDEIIHRQSRTNFDNSNMRTVLFNIAFILASFLVPAYLSGYIPTQWTRSLQPYSTYTVLALQLLSLANIGMAITPLFRKTDTCEDVPLTPAQRQILGLPPMSRQATPQETARYATPPRYSRSATPGSNSSSLRAEVGGSPLSGRGTPYSSSGSPFGSAQQQQRRSSESPLTPNGGFRSTERRRLSYNQRSSPLSTSEFDAAGSVSTATKTNSRASVGLNSKWLYEKGRGVPISGGGWGTGSVFS